MSAEALIRFPFPHHDAYGQEIVSGMLVKCVRGAYTGCQGTVGRLCQKMGVEVTQHDQTRYLPEVFWKHPTNVRVVDADLFVDEGL